MLPTLVGDTTAAKQMLHDHTLNTLTLPVNVVITEAEGDMRSFGLNFTAVTHETLYRL